MTTVEELSINNTRVWKFSSGREVLGYLGIDSEIAGKACGGLRCISGLDAEEISGLAKAMTLKYGFLGLPQGGAKAGILSLPDESKEVRVKKLSEFGIALKPWLKSGSYFPGTDMGITLDDLRVILDSAGIMLKPWRLGCRDSGLYTAATVFAGILAACGKKGKPLDSCTFALEGFGAVGIPLAEFLHRAGGRIIALSNQSTALYNEKGIDIPLLLEKKRKGHPDPLACITSVQTIPHQEILTLPVDILSLCARHDRITADNAETIRSWAVISGANNPVTPGAEQVLRSMGITCLPDFVTNSGGVLGGTMSFAGIGKPRIIQFLLDRFQPVYDDLFAGAEKQGIPVRKYAEGLALERHKRVKSAAENPGFRKRLLARGLDTYRAGLFPKSLMGRVSISYFRNLPVFRLD